jgi:hypothetical protein
MSNQQQAHIPIVQQGGFVSSLQVLINNMDSPTKLIYGFLIILIIVYSSVIPSEYHTFMDSLAGRILGVGIVYGVIHSMGWVYGLLTAMAFLLLLNGSPSSWIFSSQEGFDGGGSVSEKKRIGKRWFVEKVLGEHPDKIATDRVNTLPVQD